MERRVLIALVLSFLVLYVYQTYVVKPVRDLRRRSRSGRRVPPARNLQPAPRAEAPPPEQGAEAPAAAPRAQPSSAKRASATSASRRATSSRCSPTAARGSRAGG